MTASDLQFRLDFALDAARRAGELILGYYQRQELPVERKRDRSPVTAADRGAEQQLRTAIGAAFPNDGILGEEYGETLGQNAYRWILDPLDGTKSFIHGVPLFGTLIGLEYDGECIVGVCRFPATNEVVYAAAGCGAWWQQGDSPPREARVSRIARLSEALFCTTTITGWQKIGRQDAFERMCASCGLARGWGDCYGHMLVATGRADVMVDPQLHPWDAAALVPILEEAGGSFVDWTGMCTIHAGNGVSVNAALKEAVLELLRPNQT